MARSNRKAAPPSIGVLLNRAHLCIIKGEVSFRKAAEYIATAAERGATQRKIAAGVGKSVGWVNALLQWRQGGYQDTPFGPSVKASRERAALFSQTEQEATPETFEQVDVFKAVVADPVQIPTPKEIAAVQEDTKKAKRIVRNVAERMAEIEAPSIADEAPAPVADHPSYSAIWLAAAFKHVVQFADSNPEMLSEIIDLVGPENFLQTIATMQAAYDDKYGADLVRASADHADDEGRPLVTADAQAGEQQDDAAAIAAEATKAKRWMN